MSTHSHDQRMSALQIANRQRTAGANVCRELRGMTPGDGCAHAAALLRDRDPRIQAMPISRFLLAVPRIGDEAARRILLSAGVLLASRRVRQLTDRQVDVIAGMLEVRQRIFPFSRAARNDRRAAA